MRLNLKTKIDVILSWGKPFTLVLSNPQLMIDDHERKLLIPWLLLLAPWSYEKPWTLNTEKSRRCPLWAFFEALAEVAIHLPSIVSSFRSTRTISLPLMQPSVDLNKGIFSWNVRLYRICPQFKCYFLYQDWCPILSTMCHMFMM